MVCIDELLDLVYSRGFSFTDLSLSNPVISDFRRCYHYKTCLFYSNLALLEDEGLIVKQRSYIAPTIDGLIKYLFTYRNDAELEDLMIKSLPNIKRILNEF